jgi:hypothetical protein
MNTRTAPLCLALLLAASGCAPKGQPSIELFEACFPPTPDTTTGTCAWPAACTAQPFGNYAIDLAHAFVLPIGVQVNNQLPDNTSTDTGGVDTNNAFIDTFSVTYAVTNAVSAVNVPDNSGPAKTAGTIPSGGNGVVEVNLMELDTPTYNSLLAAVAALPLPPSGLATDKMLHVEAKVKLNGTLGDGSTFETSERIFGIQVCFGCLGIPTCAPGKTLFMCPGGFVEPATFTCASNT